MEDDAAVVLFIKMPHLNAEPHKCFPPPIPYHHSRSEKRSSITIDCFHMDTNSVSPLPPMEAPMAMLDSEKTPPGTPNGEMPPPPDEK